MLHALVYRSARVIAHWFVRELRIEGDMLPPEGPVVMIVRLTRPFFDAAVVQQGAPRPLWFVTPARRARAIGAEHLLPSFGLIPLIDEHDGRHQVGECRHYRERLREVMANGGGVVLNSTPTQDSAPCAEVVDALRISLQLEDGRSHGRAVQIYVAALCLDPQLTPRVRMRLQRVATLSEWQTRFQGDALATVRALSETVTSAQMQLEQAVQSNETSQRLRDAKHAVQPGWQLDVDQLLLPLLLLDAALLSPLRFWRPAGVIPLYVVPLWYLLLLSITAFCDWWQLFLFVAVTALLRSVVHQRFARVVSRLDGLLSLS